MTYFAGRVAVPVVPDFSGFQKSVNRQATGAGNQFSQQFGKSSQSQMSKVGSGISKSLKTGMKLTGVAVAATAALAIKGGITRLMGIEDARASLKGLGHDTASVNKIMANALAAVKGTAFGMADAAKIAASSVAAGIKPGKELTAHLKRVADAATIAKVPIGEMGAVFNKVASSNKVQGDVINQLNDKGIPIVQLLGKAMGKTAEEVTALSSKGKIDFATFSKAMQSGMGGAALKSGNTTSGAFKNMNAALGRVGANLLSGFFPKIAGGFTGITKGLGPLEDKATIAGKALGDFGAKYGPMAAEAIKSIAGKIKDLAVAAGPTLLKGFDALKVVFQWMVDNKQVVATFFGVVAAGIIVIRTFVAVQAALNAVMAINPFVLIIVAVAALVAALVYAYKKSETFRDIVNGVWAAIKVGLSLAWAIIQPVFATLGNWLGVVLPVAANLLKTIFSVVWTVVKTGITVAWAVIQPVFAMLGNVLGVVLPAAVNVLKTIFSVVWSAISIGIKVWWFGVRVVFAALKTYLETVVFPIVRFLWANVFKPAFDGISAVVSTVWENVIKPIFSKISAAIGVMKDAFKSAVSGIKTAWNGIKSAMAGPVNWVIDNVINKLIGAINWVTSKIGGPQLRKVANVGDGKAQADSIAGPGRGQTRIGGIGRRVATASMGARSGGNSTHSWPANTRALSNNYAGHSGLDIAAGMGSPIKAASNGTVEYAGWNRGFGQAIFVRGSDGLLQIYGHSSKVDVRAGQKVVSGQTLGRVGSTGHSTGPHLHFEIARSAPGTTSNRDATLAWLSGAKMGPAVDAFNPIAALKGKISSITGAGAPGLFGKMIGPGIANLLKKAAIAFISNPAKLAKGVFDKLNPFGGFGHIKTGVYDTGGWLMPGQGGVNLSSKPEPVFTDQQWATLRQSTGMSGMTAPKRATESSLIDAGGAGDGLSDELLSEVQSLRKAVVNIPGAIVTESRRRGGR